MYLSVAVVVVNRRRTATAAESLEMSRSLRGNYSHTLSQFLADHAAFIC